MVKESRGFSHSMKEVTALRDQLRASEEENRLLKQKLIEISVQIERLDQHPLHEPKQVLK